MEEHAQLHIPPSLFLMLIEEENGWVPEPVWINKKKKKSPYNPLYQLLPKHACDFYIGYHCKNISGQGKMYENCYMYSKSSSFSRTKLLKNP
jgi:hypothetical protein